MGKSRYSMPDMQTFVLVAIGAITASLWLVVVVLLVLKFVR